MNKKENTITEKESENIIKEIIEENGFRIDEYVKDFSEVVEDE